jgi:dTDP-4-amino-4,6-dideoxy-D-glucose acyltransferase
VSDLPDHRGIGAVGDETVIHQTVEVFGGESIRVGAHSRIDCFALLTAGPGVVDIGDYVHVAAGVMIYGTEGVTVGEGSALSARVMVFSKSDYPTGHLVSPLLPEHLTSPRGAPVIIEPHVMVGAGSVILPGVRLGYGSSVGALSLVKEDVEPHARVAGVPARRIGTRDPEQLARCVAEFAALQGTRERR